MSQSAENDATSGGGCMASATDSSHLCSTDCVPVYCPFSGDGTCTAGLDYCPSMHQRMCVNGEEER